MGIIDSIPERDEELCRLWETGTKTKLDLAQKFGLSEARIYQILKREGYETTFSKYPGPEYDDPERNKIDWDELKKYPFAQPKTGYQQFSDLEIFRAYDENPTKSVEEVAKIVGCTFHTIYARLRARRERGWVDRTLHLRPFSNPKNWSNRSPAQVKADQELYYSQRDKPEALEPPPGVVKGNGSKSPAKSPRQTLSKLDRSTASSLHQLGWSLSRLASVYGMEEGEIESELR